MTSQQLFVELLHRLRKYSDAAVLHAVLQQHGDVTEFKTSAVKLALDTLGGQIVKRQAQQALERLSRLGLLEIRVHANYRTLIKVDRDAVMALLRQPVSPFLPGLRADGFPFLDHVNSSVAEEP